MADTAPSSEAKTAPRPVYGQHHKFLPLPILPHHAQWFEAGPVTFAAEVRVIQEKDKAELNRTVSIHVFNAERTEEYARFDDFAGFSHYHYIHNTPQHNIVWGYDAVMNGPMLPWALAAIRERLPAILRQAQANELADRIAREGFDKTAVDRMETAIAEWNPRPDPDILEETRAWGEEWKRRHPQFNTAE